MRKKEIKKILLDDLDKNYKFDVDFKQIYDNYLEKNGTLIQEKQNLSDYKQKKNPFKIATKWLSVSLACCVVILCVVIGKCFSMHNNSAVIYPGLENYFVSEFSVVDFNKYDVIAYDANTKLYIFEGHTKENDGTGSVVYFYSLLTNEKLNMTIILPSSTREIGNQCYGTLAKFKDDNAIHTIEFSLQVGEQITNYSLQK